jgi:hypothetical protein
MIARLAKLFTQHAPAVNYDTLDFYVFKNHLPFTKKLFEQVVDLTITATHHSFRFPSAVVTIAAKTGNLRTLWNLAAQSGAFDNCKSSTMSKMLKGAKSGSKANLSVRFYRGISKAFKELDPKTIQMLFDNKELLYDGVLERLNNETPEVQINTLCILLLCTKNNIENSMKQVELLIKLCVESRNVVKWVIKYCPKSQQVALDSMNYILGRLAFINNENEVKTHPSLWDL